MASLYLTTSQLADYCYRAGFRGTALQKAIAVVLAESGGNVYSDNLNYNGSHDWGLFQLNSIHTDVTKVLAFDPLWNARYGFKLSRSGTYWSPWVAYTNGAYLKYMTKAVIASADADPKVVPPNIVSLWSLRSQVMDMKSHYQVKIVQNALVKEGFLSPIMVDGVYGTSTVSAYKRVQQKIGLAAWVCDGKPGTTSLDYLSKKYGFTWVQ